MSASDTAPARSDPGGFFLPGPVCPGQSQHELSKGRLHSSHCAVNRSLPTFLVDLRNPNMTKRDPVVADIAPSADTLTSYDNYPFSQHVSYIVDSVQHVDSFRFTSLQSTGMRQIPVSSRAMMTTAVHRVDYVKQDRR
jgi:hypothetical protein